MPALPRGIILNWSGSIATIPPGYVLCDGNNGTPDLRIRFVIGSGGSYPVDDTGGSIQHSHNFTTNTHRHEINPGNNIEFGAGYASKTTFELDTGTTNIRGLLPPYYVLAFIMKT